MFSFPAGLGVPVKNALPQGIVSADTFLSSHPLKQMGIQKGTSMIE